MNNAQMNDDTDWARSKPLFRELWKFNISTNKFIKISTNGPFPKVTKAFCKFFLKKKIIIICFCLGNGITLS